MAAVGKIYQESLPLRTLFVINTEGQVHTWKYIIKALSKHGHTVTIIARKYGKTLELLNDEGLEYIPFVPIRYRYFKAFDLVRHTFYGFLARNNIKPDIVLGFGIDAVAIARVLGKPSIVFTDSEPVGIQNSLIKAFAQAVITPSSFRIDLGENQISIEGYKELAYLHPNYFIPATAILNELGVKPGEKYVILRFNVFDAVHDIGRHGFAVSDQFRLVDELGKYARVFISPEGPLPKELEAHRLEIAHDRIHHALFYAQLLVTDTQTMTTEAAILGTPAIRCNSFVGPNDMGNFIELENKYDLIYSFREPEQAIQKAVQLIRQPDLKEQWAVKRQRLLADKIDVTQFMVDFIENYPGSFRKYKEANRNS